jgi:hypothetical protein
MDMHMHHKHGLAELPRTCRITYIWTCSIDMYMDIQRGHGLRHAAWKMDMQHGITMEVDVQHGHSIENEHEHGHAA